MASLASALLWRQAAAQSPIVVSPAGPVTTLTQGLVLAPSGGTIRVRAGTYREPPIRITRPVTIVGDSGAVFEGGDHGIFFVTADHVTLRGLTLRHVVPSFIEDRAAIRFDSVSACVVEDSRLEDTFFGIYLARSTGCRLSRNVIAGEGTSEVHSGNAIHLWNSSDVTVDGNLLTGHRDGIYLEFSRGARILRNESTRNHRYGLHFMFSHECEYRENRFAANGAGVAVMYSRQVVMDRNRFEDNWGRGRLRPPPQGDPRQPDHPEHHQREQRRPTSRVPRATKSVAMPSSPTAGPSGCWPMRSRTASPGTSSRAIRSTSRPTAAATSASSAKTTGTSTRDMISIGTATATSRSGRCGSFRCSCSGTSRR